MQITSVCPGQLRQFKDMTKLCLVYNVEGVRVDLVYDNGVKDSVFAGWLADSSEVISDFEVDHGKASK